MSFHCPYCKHEAQFEPGNMMIETEGGVVVVHEECYQQSGEDQGYVERLHRTLDDEDDQKFFSLNR
jgi:hypothetical protein